jgi:DNA repair exonuclease SbcCD ATPase subunit
VRAPLSTFFGAGSRIVGLGLALLAAAPTAGCHRNGGGASEADTAAVKKSFDDLKGRLKALEAQFGDLRKKIETIPTDVPHYQETRETFFATEEGRGVVDAKMNLLSTRLDAAMASKKPEELQELSKEIATTGTSVGQLEQMYVTVLHQVMTLQRSVEKQQQAKEAAAKAAAEEAAAKPAPGKHKGEKKAH